MTENNLPPHLLPGERLVLFDGVCKLCNGWAKFLIRHDQQQLFRLASVQSVEGQAILQWYGLPLDHFDTMAYVWPTVAALECRTAHSRAIATAVVLVGVVAAVPKAVTRLVLRPHCAEPLPLIWSLRQLPNSQCRSHQALSLRRRYSSRNCPVPVAPA